MGSRMEASKRKTVSDERPIRKNWRTGGALPRTEVDHVKEQTAMHDDNLHGS